MNGRSVSQIIALASLCALVPALPMQPGRLHAQDQVAVAKHDLQRGVVITEDDVIMQPSSGRSGDAGGAGWITRRLVRAGEELRAPAVARPELVGRGATVEVRRSTGAVQLSVTGTAVAGAGLGERIRVRIARGWTVEGMVVGPALVELMNESREM